jgi:hypothetical protein
MFLIPNQPRRAISGSKPIALSLLVLGNPVTQVSGYACIKRAVLLVGGDVNVTGHATT